MIYEIKPRTNIVFLSTDTIELINRLNILKDMYKAGNSIVMNEVSAILRQL